MILPIACICGANYDVDFEPVNGQVPGPVHCPACGADSTVIVRRKLALALADAPPEPKPAPVEEAPVTPTHCIRHPHASLQIFCFVCKKPMCTECMEQFGFVCSPYCKRRGEELGMEIPVYENQRAVVDKQKNERLNRLTVEIGIFVLLVIGFWIWYVTFGSRPHVEFRVKMSEAEQPLYARFIAPHQTLMVTHWRATLYDVSAQKAIWSTTLANISEPAVQVTAQDIWIRSADAVLRLDRKTGNQKDRVPIIGWMQKYTATPASILVVSRTQVDETMLTQISLPSGLVSSNVFKTALARQSSPALAKSTSDEDVEAPQLQEFRDDFLPAGVNCVELVVQLEKARIVAQTTMKKENSSGVSSEVRMTETGVFAEDLMNDMQRQRTGGIRKADESTYAVTLRRQLGQPGVEWTGEVTGNPQIYPLATLDVLIAGKRLIVFDKADHPLWESTLPYEVNQALNTHGDESFPCVEAGNALYVFDRGVLTAFDARNGAVRWRLPSVGISKLTFDDQGNVYVSTTSAGLEAIQYSEQLNLREKIVPVILKVVAASGKTLWRTEQSGDTCYQSAGFVYFTRTQQASMGMLTAGGAAGPDASHFRVLRANPRNGESEWDYYQPGEPIAVDFQGTRILLLYERELQILKFLSL